VHLQQHEKPLDPKRWRT